MNGAEKRQTSAGKVLGALALFTPERPVWSPERAAKRLDVSLATSYRYFNTLLEAGLLEKLQRNQYVLGPAIVELDRQVRAADPVLRQARPVMERLLKRVHEPAAVLLCRYYRGMVMCIHQETNKTGEPVSSYERGARRPMFRGSTSKAILAHLPPRTIANLWRDHKREIVDAGLGETFDDFKANLRVLRREPTHIGRGEVDPGRLGIAAPIFDANRRIAGSLSLVLLSPRVGERAIARLRTNVFAAAREIERLRGRAAAPETKA
jgi:DNA-binding IclR family transcriptional regulator